MRDQAGDIPQNTDRLLVAIVQSAVGQPVHSVQHIRGIGMNNSVSVVTTPTGRLVVRTNVESHLFRYQREAWCYRQLASTPVPVPQVLATGVMNGCSYSLARFIEGSAPITPDSDQLHIWRTLGGYGRHLNALKPPDSQSERSALFPQDWHAQVAADVGLIFKDSLWQDRGLLTALQQEQVHRRLLSCASPAHPLGICQFDMTTANAVVCADEGSKVYLLDLESANIAPVPFYQLACIAAERGPNSEVTRAYFEGYGADIELMGPDFSLFLLYRLMRATAWARDRYPALLDENIERTRPTLLASL